MNTEKHKDEIGLNQPIEYVIEECSQENNRQHGGMLRRTVTIMVALLFFLTSGLVAYAAMTYRLEMRNVIKIGDIDVQLHQVDAQGIPLSQSAVKVVPGTTYDAVVFVENVGDHPAFLRISMELSLYNTRTRAHSGAENIQLKLSDNGMWSEQNGWYYYAEALDPGENSLPLLDAVVFKGEMEGLDKDETIRLKIVLHGLQSENNNQNPKEALGWPKG